MPGLIIALGMAAAAVAAVLMWRWTEAWERVASARAKAGGDERAAQIAALTERVEVIEKYMKGEST